MSEDTWWCAVERLAQELLAVGTLRYREVQTLVATTRHRYIRETMTAHRSWKHPPRPAVS